MSLTALHQLTIKRTISATPERVFEGWTNPHKAKQWLFATPTGAIVRAEVDLRVGGKFYFTDRRDGVDVEHVGEYLEIDRPRKLVFTFAVPMYSKQLTTVTIELVRVPVGCELTLTHEGVLPEWAEKTQEGWGKLLAGLETVVNPAERLGVVSGGDTIRFERMLPGPIKRVWSYLTDSEKRKTWLASGVMDLKAGSKTEMVWRNNSLSDLDIPAPAKYAKHADESRGTWTILDVAPPTLLEVDWDNVGQVRFELVAIGQNVRLVLTHRNAPNRNMLLSVSAGWHSHLEILENRVRGELPVGLWATMVQMREVYEKRV